MLITLSFYMRKCLVKLLTVFSKYKMEGFGEIEIMLFKKIKWPYIKATQLHSYPGVRMLEPGSLVDKL